MHAERNFWRLLAAYERLTQDESAAIGAGDFDAVNAIQGTKEAILPTLLVFSTEAGLDRDNAEFVQRIDAILCRLVETEAQLATRLAEARTERLQVDHARQRLRELGGAYGEKPDRTPFSAHV
jgi:hypothetical protein